MVVRRTLVKYLLAGIIGAACLLALPAAHAQDVLARAASAPPPASALPPPDLHAGGATTQSLPLPSTAIPPSRAPAARAHDTLPPDVATSTNANGDTIQTYSRNGHIYMVTVTPRHGVTQTYREDNLDGRLTHDPRLGPVAPVYYTIYPWGGAAKAKQPAASSSSGQ